MATPLDLQEQEQLDELKHFWKRWGNLITWALIVVLGAFAAYNGWNYWQRSEAAKAAAMKDTLEQALQSRDTARLQRSLADLQQGYARTLQAQQGSLLAAASLQAQGQGDAARAALTWASQNGPDEALRDIARLRLASLLLDQKAYDQARTVLSAPFRPALSGLAHDLQGDLAMAQGQAAQAIEAWKKAHELLSEEPDFRRLVQAKLNAQGVQP